jgi:hypothetical protein
MEHLYIRLLPELSELQKNEPKSLKSLRCAQNRTLPRDVDWGGLARSADAGSPAKPWIFKRRDQASSSHA